MSPLHIHEIVDGWNGRAPYDFYEAVRAKITDEGMDEDDAVVETYDAMTYGMDGYDVQD